MTTGGCLCGELRYELEGEPLSKAICHCKTCQRFTGSAFSTDIIYPTQSFKITSSSQQGKTYSAKQDSGVVFTLTFCPNCGTTIAKRAADGQGDAFKGIVIVQAGTLDGGIDGMEPVEELWVSKRAVWLQGLSGKEQKSEFQ